MQESDKETATNNCNDERKSPLIAKADDENSYRQILKSSSIIGGSTIINALLGLVRTKVIAILIGPAGVGLLSTYQSITQLATTLASFGIQTSGVREIAKSVGDKDWEALARTSQTVRRFCVLAGTAGLLLMLLLAPLLSQLTFGDASHIRSLSALAVIILLNNVFAAQIALVHGTRRIAELAKISIFGSVAGTTISAAIYYALGINGIVPALILISLANLLVAYWFAAKINCPQIRTSWSETSASIKRLIPFGAAMVVNGLATDGVAYCNRLMIMNKFGVEGVGIYAAAFALSGLFVQFVLQAMSADFYPRLTAASADDTQMVKLINEQTEIGLLLAFPGLLGTLIFAPFAIQVFYSPEFGPASKLLQWFVVGCYGRVVSWPLGFSVLAKGQSKLFASIELLSNLLHLALVALLIQIAGLNGVAIAFAILYVIYTLGVYQINRKTIGFRWNRRNKGLVLGMSALTLLMLTLESFEPCFQRIVLSTVILATVTASCVYRLNQATDLLNRLFRRLP